MIIVDDFRYHLEIVITALSFVGARGIADVKLKSVTRLVGSNFGEVYLIDVVLRRSES